MLIAVDGLNWIVHYVINLVVHSMVWKRANLHAADHRKANLGEADLSRADLRGTDLLKANPSEDKLFFVKYDKNTK